MRKMLFLFIIATIFSCDKNISKTKISKNIENKEFVWEGANIYFLLTDRFNNGDTSNDVNFERTEKTGVLRGFEGGDIKGISQKIKEGYFTELGINAIWMTPVVEQIHGATNEGTGVSYGYHGYWAKDWTKIDPNFGTKEDLKELVFLAHEKGIRVVLDAVINHTGPGTKKDPVWPSDWVRTGPKCSYENYENTISCTLVENLPDIRTASNTPVALPPQLVEKWKEEGRYEQEVKELDAFFSRTGHPRAPRFYIMKWLSDYITEFGIDGYRVDTVKHTEEFVWQEFKTVCDDAFARYKSNNVEKVIDDTNFYLVGEVYNYQISQGISYDFGDKKVNYFDKAFQSLLNFELKWNAKQMSAQKVFSKYDSILNYELKSYGVLNYMTSHDDGQPFDKERRMPYKTATMLLLTPGASQLYYGDEIARNLNISGAVGDATLRSFMPWDRMQNNEEKALVLRHWQKLGQFKANHMALGAGKHQLISEERGLVFSRIRNKDKVIVGIDLSKGQKLFDVASVFKNGTELRDAYSNKKMTVYEGQVQLDTPYKFALLEEYLRD
jgi:alpha-amylase